MKLSIHLFALIPLALAGSYDNDNTNAILLRRGNKAHSCRKVNQATWKTWKETGSGYTTRSTTTTEDYPQTLSTTTSTSTDDAVTTSSSTTSIVTTTTTTSESTTTSSSTSTSITSSTTSSTASTSSTTSSSTAPPSTTTSSGPTGKVVYPGASFTPTAEISNGKLAKRSTVYIDMNTNANAGRITTDITLATKFDITADGVLETTLRSYPNICGTSSFNSAPSLFYCDNSGGIPGTYKGWTNSPVFEYKTWTWCYKSDFTLYMLQSSTPPSDCTPITFSANFDSK